MWNLRGRGDGWSQYAAALSECLQHINGRARESLNLFYRDQLSREQIAQRLEMQPDGVKTMLRRTREKLRDCVQRKVQS